MDERKNKKCDLEVEIFNKKPKIEFSYDKSKYDLNYYTKIPNKFLRDGFLEYYNINKIIFVLYIEIDRNRSLTDDSYIIINDILELCGYNISPTSKPKIFYEIIRALVFLEKNNYIHYPQFDPYNVGYKDFICIHIVRDNFDSISNFTLIYWKDYHKVLDSESNLRKENLLITYLYMASYIGYRAETDNNPEDTPLAFFKNTSNTAKDLNVSRDTLNLCMKELVDIGLLIKKKTGSVMTNKSKTPKNVPNIYVLKRKGWEKEMEWAYDKLLRIYKVDHFDDSKGKINKKEDKIGGIDVADE